MATEAEKVGTEKLGLWRRRIKPFLLHPIVRRYDDPPTSQPQAPPAHPRAQSTPPCVNAKVPSDSWSFCPAAHAFSKFTQITPPRESENSDWPRLLVCFATRSPPLRRPPFSARSLPCGGLPSRRVLRLTRVSSPCTSHRSCLHHHCPRHPPPRHPPPDSSTRRAGSLLSRRSAAPCGCICPSQPGSWVVFRIILK